MGKAKKLGQLITDIMGEKSNKTIIFTSTKRKADEITIQMRRDGYSVLALVACFVPLLR